MRAKIAVGLCLVLCAGVPATAGELMNKDVCTRMGNTEAACTCADQHMKASMQGQVSARAFELLQKSDFKTLQGELSQADNQSLTRAMVSAHQAAAEACSLERE